MRKSSAKLAQNPQLDGSSAKKAPVKQHFAGTIEDLGETVVASFMLEIGSETRYIRVEMVKAELLRGEIDWSQR